MIVSDPLTDTDGKKKCTVLKDASVYILADYRKDYCQDMICRLYSYCISEGYDLKWVGYSESEEECSFIADGKKIMFSPTVYDNFDTSNLDLDHNITYLFVGTLEDEEAEPTIACLTTSLSERRAKRLLRLANDFQTSNETDVKNRFAVVSRIESMENINRKVVDNIYLLQLLRVIDIFFRF